MSERTNRQSSSKSRCPFFSNSVKTGGSGATFETTSKGDIKRGVIMNRLGVWKAVGVVLVAFGMQLLCGLQSFAQQPGVANRGKFIVFDAPGAAPGQGSGTFPSGINVAGQITGTYYDANS